ncbi:universal stress protein [Natronomonas marina]|jgi:nucleotide-binding universal stress UspA family protein|uniref:universal stress protein n=1 Tax=Natronomonas marina TaxID=2961939 RepID=UPI0020C9BC6B|nr:universal stress protein [Natronomonas marina]
MTIRTVAVAVGPDDEKRAESLATAAIEVAGGAEAVVVLLHVFTESAYEEGVREAGYDPEDPPPAHTLASRLQAVDAIAALLEAAGVEHRVRGEVGDEPEGILRGAEAVGADRLLIGGRRRSPTGKAVFGSTAHRVLMNAGCPVTFVRDGASAGDE